MAPPLGRSKTIRWALCACRFCEGSRALFRYTKRAARRREEQMWRRDILAAEHLEEPSC